MCKQDENADIVFALSEIAGEYQLGEEDTEYMSGTANFLSEFVESATSSLEGKALGPVIESLIVLRNIDLRSGSVEYAKSIYELDIQCQLEIKREDRSRVSFQEFCRRCFGILDLNTLNKQLWVYYKPYFEYYDAVTPRSSIFQLMDIVMNSAKEHERLKLERKNL